MPSSVIAIGIRARSAKRRTASVAPERMMPCPARITGRSAELIRRSASAIELGFTHPLRPGVRLWFGRFPVEVTGRLLRVLGDVDEHRSGAATGGDLKGLAHCWTDVLRSRDEVVVLRHRQRDAGDVGLLETVAANELAADLSGDADDRRRVHHRGGDAGDHVGRARSRRRDGDANLAARPRVAVGHVRGALLVAHQHVSYGVVEHGIVRRENRAAGVTENGRHSLADETFPKDLRTSSLHSGLTPRIFYQRSRGPTSLRWPTSTG